MQNATKYTNLLVSSQIFFGHFLTKELSQKVPTLVFSCYESQFFQDEEEKKKKENRSCTQSSFLQRHQSLKDIPTLDMHVNWCPTRPLRQIVIGKKSSSDSRPAKLEPPHLQSYRLYNLSVHIQEAQNYIQQNPLYCDIIFWCTRTDLFHRISFRETLTNFSFTATGKREVTQRLSKYQLGIMSQL